MIKIQYIKSYIAIISHENQHQNIGSFYKPKYLKQSDQNNIKCSQLVKILPPPKTTHYQLNHIFIINVI